MFCIPPSMTKFILVSLRKLKLDCTFTIMEQKKGGLHAIVLGSSFMRNHLIRVQKQFKEKKNSNQLVVADGYERSY